MPNLSNVVFINRIDLVNALRLETTRGPLYNLLVRSADAPGPTDTSSPDFDEELATDPPPEALEAALPGAEAELHREFRIYQRDRLIRPCASIIVLNPGAPRLHTVLDTMRATTTSNFAAGVIRFDSAGRYIGRTLPETSIDVELRTVRRAVPRPGPISASEIELAPFRPTT